MAEEVEVTAATAADLPEVQAMLQEYGAWVRIDLSFQSFAREVATLPGDYTPPGGALLIARRGADTVGMVAFRRWDAHTAEMKRLFVRETARGSGAGQRLVDAVIEAARHAGYTRMLLDTLPSMGSAQRLYERFGFRDVPPYYHSPIAGTRYMALTLSV